MKSIVSGGGPLIILHSADMCRWGGINHLVFFAGRVSTKNDYEALCDIMMKGPHRVIDAVTSNEGAFLMLAIPLETLIVDASTDHLYIVQIETAETGWSDSDLSASDFNKVTEWRDAVEVSIKGGPIIIFDSAWVESDLRDYEILTTNLSQGTFVCDWSEQLWPGRARMNFIRLVKQ